MTKMIDDLNWRYATKKFDPNRKVSKEDVEELLEALRLSASSFGLQPWKFLVITNRVLREKLREQAWGQAQITDASHLIVLCVNKNVDEEYVKKYVKAIAKTRGVPAETLKDYEDMMINSVKGKTPAEIMEWSRRQVYIALGFLLSACAQKRIDACPMEGFNHDKFNEILCLGREGFEAVALCPIGYRAADDGYAKAKKVRFSKDDMFDFR